MNDYNFLNDILTTFRASSEWVQVLWLAAFVIALLGLQWMVAFIVYALAGGKRRRKKADLHGELCYSIIRGSNGESLVYRHTRDGDTTAIEPMILLPNTRK